MQEIQVLRGCLVDKKWCDWEVVSFAGNTLVIGGGTSLSFPHKILITFRAVDVFSGKLDWSTEDPDGVYVAHGDEAEAVSYQFGIEDDKTVFIFVNYRCDNRKVIVAADSIELSGEWLDGKLGVAGRVV